METENTTIEVSPPRLIKSLTEGFNTVANHIGLILLPVILDLFIWLGPHFKMETLLKPMLDNMFKTLATMNTVEMQPILEQASETWMIFIKNINLSSTLSTFPIGLPSLMKRSGSFETPIGQPATIELSSYISTFLIWLVFMILGIFLGGLYLSYISHKTAPEGKKVELNQVAYQVLNGFALSIILIVVAIVLAIPTMMFISILGVFSFQLSQFAMLAITFFLIWVLVPLVFSVHGIFAFQLNVLKSMLTSIRFVRAFFPGVGMFLLSTILLAQGLDFLWRAAPGSSWFTLIGIAGHAFIYTGILASSFIFYRQGLAWIQNNIAQYKKSIKL